MINHRTFPRCAAGLACAVFTVLQSQSATLDPLRPPAVPLVACDPYFSIWSPADNLADADTMHWTRRPHRLASLVRIDGQAFRLLGKEPAGVTALPQQKLQVLPTRTICTFAGQGVQVTLSFMTPALPDDLMVYARPVTYLTWTAQAIDGKEHAVAVYFDASAEITVNDPSQKVLVSSEEAGGLLTAKLGSQDQPVLAKKGDDLRIDWGHLYVAAATKAKPWTALGSSAELRDGFGKGGSASLSETRSPRPASDGLPVAAFAFDLGQVGRAPVSRWLILAYDDEFALQYFKRNLRPYWRRNGDDAAVLLQKSAAEYASLAQRCARFDAEFMDDLTKVGGEKYARLCALLYRQAITGTKLVTDANGQPLLFPKENTSNGCIGTVDVIYPMSPLFLLFGPSLTKAMLVPALDYASSPRWKFPFAPHDLGAYPQANGQVYGGGERTEADQMPVEETANMMILITALAKMEGNAEFAGKYWPTLTKWADYLKAKGFDPERQLCTDDFAGHLAHNVNLSAKAIVALGAYGRLCELHGDQARAREYGELAKEFVARWLKEADDGDHFRLAFDQPGTWSQKYNLIWDRVLDLNLFPADVLRKEMAYYLKVMHRFGLALDNRKPYAELPWTFWTASLTGNANDFEKLFAPIYDYTQATPSRVPFADFYWTETAKEAGMHARPVIGGIFIKPLLAPALWSKWAGRDQTKAANWAALPQPPKVTTVLSAADQQPGEWSYTTVKPADDWFKPAFDCSVWKRGRGGFGTAGTPGAIIGTVWNTADIWLRREVDLPAHNWHDLQAWLHHDEDAEVYVNGVLALKIAGWGTDYEAVPFTAAGNAAFKPGRNSLALHCHQTSGGQYVDVGLVDVETNSR